MATLQVPVLFDMSGDTIVFGEAAGADFVSSHLEFTLDREPNNKQALKLLNSIKNSEAGSVITNLKMENDINTFFRLSNNTIIDRLREDFPELSSNPSQKEVFLLLRKLRNKW